MRVVLGCCCCDGGGVDAFGVVPVESWRERIVSGDSLVELSKCEMQWCCRRTR